MRCRPQSTDGAWDSPLRFGPTHRGKGIAGFVGGRGRAPLAGKGTWFLNKFVKSSDLSRRPDLMYMQNAFGNVRKKDFNPLADNNRWSMSGGVKRPSGERCPVTILEQGQLTQDGTLPRRGDRGGYCRGAVLKDRGRVGTFRPCPKARRTDMVDD